MHHRANNFKPKVENRRLSFYAAVFDTPTRVRDTKINPTSYTEVIKAGAFSNALATGVDIIATAEHNINQPYSRRSAGLLVQEDAKGLFCSCWLPDNEIGNKVKSLVEQGSFGGASFGFSGYKRSANPDVVEMEHLDLFEVSLVEDPAYPTDEPHLRNDKHLKNLLRWFKILRLKK